MTQASSPFIQSIIDWLRGEDAILYKPLPERVREDLETKHINDLLHRHPFHPYDPEMKEDHPCAPLNKAFLDCMEQWEDCGFMTHEKHIRCFNPHKVDLMKCLVKHKHPNALPKNKQTA